MDETVRSILINYLLDFVQKIGHSFKDYAFMLPQRQMRLSSSLTPQIDEDDVLAGYGEIEDEL